MPVSLISNSSDTTPLWELLARLLPSGAEWHTPADVARLFGLTTAAVLKHCRDLWPQWEGQYRLDRDEATRLIKRIAFVSRRVPSRDSVLRRLDKGGDAA